MKNLAINGALVKLVADGAGSFSFGEGVEESDTRFYTYKIQDGDFII